MGSLDARPVEAAKVSRKVNIEQEVKVVLMGRIHDDAISSVNMLLRTLSADLEHTCRTFPDRHQIPGKSV